MTGFCQAKFVKNRKMKYDTMTVLFLNFSIGSHKGARLQTTPPEHIAAGTTVSTLTILQAEISDSGKYTCLPAQLESASVNLHVLESEYTALYIT